MKKIWVKRLIMAVATVLCVYGAMGSIEPANYGLWWLMFLLVYVTT